MELGHSHPYCIFTTSIILCNLDLVVILTLVQNRFESYACCHAMLSIISIGMNAQTYRYEVNVHTHYKVVPIKRVESTVLK